MPPARLSSTQWASRSCAAWPRCTRRLTQCARGRRGASRCYPAGADSPTEEESAAGEGDDKNWWEEGWQEILAQVQQDSHNLHEFLAYAEVCDETEAYWQDAAAAGDVVALAYKAIAATVDGLPISTPP